MSELKIESYYVVPKLVIPLKESLESIYVIVYYSGSSLCVYCYCETYSFAKAVYEDLQQDKDIEYHILCIKINIERFFLPISKA